MQIIINQYKQTRILITLFTVYSFIAIQAQHNPLIEPKEVQAWYMGENELPLIDGQLDDVIWQEQKGWQSGFVQREPIENAQPTEETFFKIVYSKKYIYVAFKNIDKQPQLINHRMSRRDGYEGDWIQIIFDSFHNRRAAFSFTVSAAGVKSDSYLSKNGSVEDLTWNPIWDTKTSIASDGWYAEMRIPTSQLRYSENGSKRWGFQVVRKLFKNQELSVWQRVPADAAGWISEFGVLAGMDSISRQRPLELQPFVVGLYESKYSANDQSASSFLANIGLDGKVGVNNEITIDYTINPDFGQVEADPAAIVLDGFQLFFQEQRPFFIENKNIFDYQFSAPIGGGSFSSDNLFYSRRIGRVPQIATSELTGFGLKTPARTTILGAAKLSGHSKKGLSFGVLESVTSAEYAVSANDKKERKQLVEPLTNYFVGHVQKDYHNRTFLGGIITSTQRKIDKTNPFLHHSATTGGIDLLHQWDDRTWYFGASLVGSYLKGSSASLIEIQRAVSHLLQRDGSSHLGVDSLSNTLAGTGGDLKIGKAGKGNIRFESGLTWRSPRLDLNDVGFMREADDIQQYSSFSYRSLKPFGVFRNGSVVYQHWIKSDFHGRLNYFDWDVELNGTFNNNWTTSLGFFSQPYIVSKSLLQGGPSIRLPNQYGFWWALTSDPRHNLSLQFNGWTKTGKGDAYFLLQNNVQINYQPFDQLVISLIPSHTLIKDRLQYNQHGIFQGQKRIVVSRLNQQTLSCAVRINYAISPNLTLQYYGQPFLSVGSYQDFGYVRDASERSQNQQILFYSSSQLRRVDLGQIDIDEDKDQNSDYSIRNPNFSFAQFRSNFVLRYEYQAGSELYLIWGQSLVDNQRVTRSIEENLHQQLLDTKVDNSFVLKWTYRWH